jgi:archaemetzincin
VAAVDLLPFGGVEEAVLETLEQTVPGELDLATRRLPALPAPLFAYDASRRQFDSTRILREAYDRRDGEAFRVLAVTEADLFIPMLSFVFGQAQLGGPAAVISTARLRQEFYGLPPDPPLLCRRAAKEALHELGHSFGLVHCLDTACVLSLSSEIRQVDVKRGAFCPGCRALLRERLAKAGASGLGPDSRKESHS